MITAPIVVPVLQNSSSSSYTQKCLERPELSDLYKKALNQEQDTERLTKCIDESKKDTAKVLVIFLAVLVAVLVAAVLFCIFM